MEKQYTVADVIEIGEAEEMILGKMGVFIDEDQNQFAGDDVD
jgi:hypothetical protein